MTIEVYHAIVPRPRKSRLVPSVSTFAEELVRVICERVDRRIDALSDQLTSELRRLEREIARVRASGAPAGLRGGRPRTERACSVPGCALPHVARGLCKNHYQQLRYAERKQRR